MYFEKPPKHSSPYRTMRELADLFTDDDMNSLEICTLLIHAREELGITPAIGYQHKYGPRYSYEQQLEIVKYNNEHERKRAPRWRKLSIEVLEKNSR